MVEWILAWSQIYESVTDNVGGSVEYCRVNAAALRTRHSSQSQQCARVLSQLTYTRNLCHPSNSHRIVGTFYHDLMYPKFALRRILHEQIPGPFLSHFGKRRKSHASHSSAVRCARLFLR